MNGRTRHLRQRALALAMTKDPNERATLVTDSYRRTEGQPPILRRAKALEHILLNETIRIFDGELIAGAQQQITHCHRGVDDRLSWANEVCYPEWRGWFGKDRKEFTPAARQALAYWRGRPTAWHRWHATLTEDARKGMKAGVFAGSAYQQGHCIPDFQKVLKHGLRAIVAEAETKLRTATEERKRLFWDAALIVCRAAIRYAERHAELAEQLAAQADDARKRELHTIAAICRRTPAQPAQTFHEALQSVWFIHRVQEIEMGDVGAFANSLGRFDQYLYPYYQGDLREGRLNSEQARELIECFWIKQHRTYNDQHVMLGGLRPDGSDATNELSHLCLDATAELRLPLAIGVRIHRKTPKDFLQKAADVAKLGLGRPHFYNDDAAIPALTEKGIQPEDARDYAVVGCVEVCIPGRGPYRTMAGVINFTKCLELALNSGRCMLTGERLSSAADGAEDAHFSSFDELRAAYRRQVAHFTRLMVESIRSAEKVQAETFPHPFLSAVTEGCVQNGRDVTEGGARYNATCPNAFEIANAANSLAAIRKVVYDEKRMTLSELVTALKTDFEGREELRQYLLNQCAKFGNDDDAVDALAREELAYWCDELAAYRNSWGEPFMPLLFTTTPASVYHYGPLTAASADGRRARQPLAASASPAHGTDRAGPTAVLKSAAKLDFRKLAGGASLILDLHPTAVAGPDNKLASLIRTFFDLGGMEIGVNVVGEEMLREAQSNPERYRTLSVRIFGYSALFVNLSQDLQEHIIAKTKHSL